VDYLGCRYPDHHHTTRDLRLLLFLADSVGEAAKESPKKQPTKATGL
jgi:hypothetical protein